MITAADIRCCTEGAAFCVKEIDLGITADLGTLQRLFRLVGEGALIAAWHLGRASCIIVHLVP
jgi:enoyl-CoA hydratase/carnithine racemase